MMDLFRKSTSNSSSIYNPPPIKSQNPIHSQPSSPSLNPPFTANTNPVSAPSPVSSPNLNQNVSPNSIQNQTTNSNSSPNASLISPRNSTETPVQSPPSKLGKTLSIFTTVIFCATALCAIFSNVTSKSSLAPLWMMVNQFQIFLLLLLIKVPISEDIRETIRGGVFSSNI